MKPADMAIRRAGPKEKAYTAAENCAPVESAKKKITNEKIRVIAAEISAGSFSDPEIPKIIAALKIYTKATNNYQSCKPDNLSCLTEAKNKYMAKPGAKGEAAAYLDAYSGKW